MDEPRQFVIVGASLAGAKAAETLREEGFDGRVVLIGEEEDLPYERPPLSKDYLRGEAEPPFVHSEDWYRTNDVELRTGQAATALDLDGRAVELAGGERVPYDALLLATGAAPRTLKVPGIELDGVRTLRRRHESDELRRAIVGAGSVAVVGAGWIGSEVAASARQIGARVTLLDLFRAPLERVLGPAISEVYRSLHAEHGVTYLPDASVTGFEGEGRVEAVRLADGSTVEADLVVIGVGVAPRTELARAAGLPVENGILVDAALRTARPEVLAAGDVANAYHPHYGRWIRVEHWANALHQGPAAARTMLGKNVTYDRLPYFYSDQYDLGMEYVGLAEPSDRLVVRGDLDKREFLAFWLQDGRVAAGMNANVWDVVDDVRALILSGVTVNEVKLADPDVPLSSLTT
jgi:3-phenylpropionate/trans-cinnamate dioxygenase ferredoxin reductase subunit